jgi:PAS domain S-box-containing protein
VIAVQRVGILVADDRPESVGALRAVLVDPSYELIAVATGAEAVAVTRRRNDLALVLLDVNMPGLDGMAAARLIRDRQPDLPIIFLTADQPDERRTTQAYAIGAVDYLVKPFDPHAVAAKVAVFVDLHRKAERIRRQEELLRAFERERNAEALRESEELLQATFEQAPVGIAHLTPSGRWQRVNPRFCAMLGRSADELADGELAVLVHADDVAELRAGLARMVGGAQASHAGELRMLPKGAPPRWVELRLSVLRSLTGHALRVIAIAQDIHARKREEESERLLHDASAELMGWLDPAAALAGLARRAVPGLAELCLVELDGQAEPLALVHDDPEVAHALGAGLAASFAPVAALELRRLEAEPSAPGPEAVLWQRGLRHLLRLPLASRSGPLGALSLARATPFDAVDLRVADELAHRASLALENGQLYAKAQEAIQVRDEFLSIASHELRTPLTPLLIQLQRLVSTRSKTTIENLGADRLRAILVRAERQVQRLGKLVDNLLDVSRIGAGHLELELDAACDLAALAREVAGRFSEELARAGSTLILHADHPVVGAWDPLRLEQVITNLLSNAVKYGPGQPIEIDVEDGDGPARLRVSDHGIGVPPERVQAIFERFERAVSPRSYGGLGLGLYIAREIVEAHGGRIAVASQLGHGAVFTVELPR